MAALARAADAGLISHAWSAKRGSAESDTLQVLSSKVRGSTYDDCPEPSGAAVPDTKADAIWTQSGCNSDAIENHCSRDVRFANPLAGDGLPRVGATALARISGFAYHDLAEAIGVTFPAAKSDAIRMQLERH